MRAGIALIWFVIVACTYATGQISSPFHYEGARAPQWLRHARTAEFVTMPDGTKIAVDVVLPAGYQDTGPAPEKFPVIFQYTPYGRSAIDLRTGEVPIPSFIEFFLRQGYAYVTADVRGTGGSDGWINPLDSRIGDDGRELVDWIAAQPWSDGNVGMTGGSYAGWTQLAVAAKRPRALKTIVPWQPGWDSS